MGLDEQDYLCKFRNAYLTGWEMTFSSCAVTLDSIPLHSHLRKVLLFASLVYVFVEINVQLMTMRCPFIWGIA